VRVTTVAAGERLRPALLRCLGDGRSDLLPVEHRRTPDEVDAQVEELSRVQRLVHLAARMTDDDVRALAERIKRDNVSTYEEALTHLARQHGCYRAEGRLGNNDIRSDIRDAAKWSAASIANTYNYELARAIRRVGEEVPTANRHVYAYRLFHAPDSWGRRYAASKAEQVAQFERWQAINLAIGHFYQFNAVGEQYAEVRPYDTLCPACAGYVAGNPYPSVEALYRNVVLPAHLGCPHYGAAVGGRVAAGECEELWLGQ
jgi:hypothetical protein